MFMYAEKLYVCVYLFVNIAWNAETRLKKLNLCIKEYIREMAGIKEYLYKVHSSTMLVCPSVMEKQNIINN